MSDLSDTVERLTRSVESLERRVGALEAARSARAASRAAPAAAAPSAAALALDHESGLFSVLGKSMLAVAGAYLLRALAESSALPRGPVVALAILYAFCWLIPATRAKSSLPSLAWAVTSAVILLPMLWELTVSFAFLPASVAAAVLAAFVVASTALAWKRHFAEVSWVADASASLAAVILALAVHDLIPFIAALLLIAGAGEVAAARHRTLRVRPLVAMAADFAVFAVVWIYSSPAASRAEYPSRGAGLLLAVLLALLVLYAASASTQTLLLRRRISFFETAQTLIAFLLLVWGIMTFFPGHSVRLLGVLCLGAAGAGYAVAFLRFDRAAAQRNFHVYATGSAALLLGGAWLALPGMWLPFCLAIVAAAATLLGARAGRRTLQYHGHACLLAATFASGLLLWEVHSLAGRFPTAPLPIHFDVAAAAILCYVAVARAAGESRSQELLRLLSAGLSLSAAAALLVWGLVRVSAGGSPAPERLALLRTLTGCALALLLAWSGARRERRELIRLAWVSLACLAGKLLFEDMRHGHLGFTAASIFLYAVTLLVLPRLVRSHPEAAKSGHL